MVVIGCSPSCAGCPSPRSMPDRWRRNRERAGGIWSLLAPVVGALQSKIAATSLWCMANPEGRRSQLLRGVLDLCLLAVMQEGPAYGYEMTKRLRARGLSMVGVGSIYPVLGRLERDALVETQRAASNGGPPRKYYRLSSGGEQALAAGVVEWTVARDAVDGALGLVKAEVRS